MKDVETDVSDYMDKLVDGLCSKLHIEEALKLTN